MQAGIVCAEGSCLYCRVRLPDGGCQMMLSFWMSFHTPALARFPSWNSGTSCSTSSSLSPSFDIGLQPKGLLYMQLFDASLMLYPCEVVPYIGLPSLCISACWHSIPLVGLCRCCGSSDGVTSREKRFHHEPSGPVQALLTVHDFHHVLAAR